MRIRVTETLQGEVDGISLEEFHAGSTYEVSTSLGTYLLACGAADLDVEHESQGRRHVAETLHFFGATSLDRALAADRPAAVSTKPEPASEDPE